MSPSPEPQNMMQMILYGMPTTVQAIVFTVLALPLVVAMSGFILQINLGKHLDTFLEAKLKQQTSQQTTIQRDLLAEALSPVENRVSRIEDWACKHSVYQRLKEDAPEFCR